MFNPKSKKEMKTFVTEDILVKVTTEEMLVMRRAVMKYGNITDDKKDKEMCESMYNDITHMLEILPW